MTPAHTSSVNGHPPAWRNPLLFALGAILLTVWFYSPVREVADVQLDASNYASYAYYTAKDFQYGTEVLPMAGPYGFVPYGFTYAGHLFGKRFPLELLTKGILALLIIWFIQRSRRRPVLTAFWLLSVLLLAPLITDLPYTLAILLSGLCLIECHAATTRRSLMVGCALAAYLALLTLFKGTQCMLSVATLSLLVLQALIRREFKRLLWIVTAYLAALIVWLVIAGQNPLNFPAYFLGMLQISAGYNLAMGVEEPLAYFVTGAGALIALELLLAMLICTAWRRFSVVAGLLYLAGFSFISWKHGFVRADGHVAIYYHYICIAVPTALLFAGVPDPNSSPRGLRRAWLKPTLALAALALALWGDGEKALLRFQWVMKSIPGNFVANAQQVVSPIRTKARFDAELADLRTYYNLPGIQDIIGGSSIDFFGIEQGYLLLNRLNYRPRPVGGGTYGIFTTDLQDINNRWFSVPGNPPDYFLVRVQAIDGRFTPQEDADTLRRLIANYAPVETVLGLTLFKALPDASSPPPLRDLGSQPLHWQTPVIPPTVSADEILLFSFTLPPSVAGKIRNFLYKPPYVSMDMEGTGIQEPLDRLIIPSMFVHPVPLNPLIENTPDLLQLYQGGTGKTVSQFSLRTGRPECFSTVEMRVHFYAAARPPSRPPVPINLNHPAISELKPDITEATYLSVNYFDRMVVLTLVPPGRLGYLLKGDENSVEFSYGMDHVSYERPTDGVDIRVLLERPGLPGQELFFQNISPQKRPEDRRTFKRVISLPPFSPGSKLWLTTGRGPDNDGAWDLPYFSKIKFHHGHYLIDQFPGFSRAPDHVEGGTNGRIPVDGREVFMLNAPGRLIFDLQLHENKIALGFGILPGAYQSGGNSDGVQFQVSLRSPDGVETLLGERMLNPREALSDRGDHQLEIVLPRHSAGSQLLISTNPGPLGDLAWDWAYLSKLRIE